MCGSWLSLARRGRRGRRVRLVRSVRRIRGTGGIHAIRDADQHHARALRLGVGDGSLMGIDGAVRLQRLDEARFGLDEGATIDQVAASGLITIFDTPSPASAGTAPLQVP